MKAHIGIFTARESLRNLLLVEKEMRELCEITYLPYSSMMELTNLYLEYEERFDGLLFSGVYPYSYINEHVCNIDKPCRYLEVADRDYYLMIARICAQRPEIDFEKVYFDTCTENKRSGDYGHYLREVFPVNRIPKINVALDYSYYLENQDSAYEKIMESYKNAWRHGKADLVVTRMTNIGRQLEREGIPYMLFQPSPATMMEYFHGLLQDIKVKRMEKSLIACCVLQIEKDRQNDETFEILKRTLEQFNSEQNMVFVLRRNENVYEAVTSLATARRLTSDYTTCLLTSYLYEALPFSTYIGWGIGYDIVMAHQNALRAMKESKDDPCRYTYMVNENDEMIGPLCGDRSISYQLRPSARTNRIAKALGISAVNLEKVRSLQKNRKMTEFSASDLVFYLDITPRSATRILKKLVEHGAATKVTSMNLNGRGRPAAIYEIDFDKIQL